MSESDVDRLRAEFARMLRRLAEDILEFAEPTGTEDPIYMAGKRSGLLLAVSLVDQAASDLAKTP